MRFGTAPRTTAFWGLARPVTLRATRPRALRRTRTSNTTLVHVPRCAAENPSNHRVECCRAPARHAHAPSCDLFRLLPGYIGDGVAPNDMVTNIEHDVSRNPYLLIVE